MTYLGPLRLQFTGQFQADPSTVNNDIRHFNNDTFQPSFQQPQDGNDMNGWWEPDGTGAFRLVGCKVTMVSYADGTSSTTDRVVGMAIADANARVAGKIVDLDPQQQLVSELWGLLVRLNDGVADLFSGAFDVAAFCDIWWARAKGSAGGGDIGAGSFYQSVIGPVTWGDTSHSPFLQELRAACPDGLLSIKFNVDGYNMNPTSGRFTMGRIVGSIGPASPHEPRHFVLGRQLLAQIANGNPSGSMNFMPAVVDTHTKKVIADFGNALPTALPGGALFDLGDLQLGYLDSANTFQSLGSVAYQQPDWYPTTGGVQAFPPDRTLTDAELTTLQTSRIAVAVNGAPLVQENFDGLYMRADQFVFRLESGETASVQLWATKFGQPLTNARVLSFRDASGLQPAGDPRDGLGPVPQFASPPGIITFPQNLTTDAHGRAVLEIKATNPNNPRGYIDGQVYGVRSLLSVVAQRLRTDPSFGLNPSDFISILVFDEYDAPAELTWTALQPVFTQYGNLFPVMTQIVDLTSYDSVAAHAHLLAFAFGLPLHDPNCMPVTRDLSRGKRAAILRWLTTPGPDGRPVRGETAPPPAVPQPEPESVEAAQADVVARVATAKAAGAHPSKGAKSFALGTRAPLQIPDDDE